MSDDEGKRYRRQVYETNSETFALAERRDVRALIALLHSPLETESVSVRFAALHHLGKIGAREAIPDIVPLVDDPDVAMRAGAVVALTRLDARAEVRHVVRALDDEHGGVRQRAAEGLATLGNGDPAAVPALVRALDDDVWHVRRVTLATLATLGDATVIPAIEASARRESFWHRRHASRAVRVLRRRT
jgi:hypothetical protein